MQILQLLKGEKDTNGWVKSYIKNIKDLGDQDDDGNYPEFSSRHLSFASLDLDEETTSDRSREQKHNIKLKDYLKEPQW